MSSVMNHPEERQGIFMFCLCCLEEEA